jgi:hypothetical protein
MPPDVGVVREGSRGVKDHDDRDDHGEALGPPFRTFETVIAETPASSAT